MGAKINGTKPEGWIKMKQLKDGQIGTTIDGELYQRVNEGFIQIGGGSGETYSSLECTVEVKVVKNGTLIEIFDNE